MDHLKIIKRAANITWFYRALWVFGIILALVTGSVSGGGGGSTAASTDSGDSGANNMEAPFMPPEFTEEIEQYGLVFEVDSFDDLPSAVQSTLIILGVVLVLTILLVMIGFPIIYYIVNTALIRSVDDYEEHGEMRKVGAGLRLGWSRAAWRMFKIDLVTILPLVVITILLLALIAGILWFGAANLDANLVMSIVILVLGTGLLFLIVLAIFVTGVALALLRDFFQRACALENLGVIPALRRGYMLFKMRIWDTLLMWLLMLGFKLIWRIAQVFIGLAALITSTLIAIVPALLLDVLAVWIFGTTRWLVAIIVAFPIFLLLLTSIMAFTAGLVEVFKSSTWTLTYRELRALEELADEEEAPPAVEPQVAAV